MFQVKHPKFSKPKYRIGHQQGLMHEMEVLGRKEL